MIMSKTIHRYREDTSYKKIRKLLPDIDQHLVDNLYLRGVRSICSKEFEEALDATGADNKTASKIMLIIQQS